MTGIELQNQKMRWEGLAVASGSLSLVGLWVMVEKLILSSGVYESDIMLPVVGIMVISCLVSAYSGLKSRKS